MPMGPRRGMKKEGKGKYSVYHLLVVYGSLGIDMAGSRKRALISRYALVQLFLIRPFSIPCSVRPVGTEYISCRPH